LTATGAGVSIDALVPLKTMLIAIEPATPTLLPPAPEVDCARNAEAAGASDSTACVRSATGTG